jgi:hypothetical protein
LPIAVIGRPGVALVTGLSIVTGVMVAAQPGGLGVAVIVPIAVVLIRMMSAGPVLGLVVPVHRRPLPVEAVGVPPGRDEAPVLGTDRTPPGQGV